MPLPAPLASDGEKAFLRMQEKLLSPRNNWSVDLGLQGDTRVRVLMQRLKPSQTGRNA
jgi:hypothetical protein